MDEANEFILSNSIAGVKILLDANVFSYAYDAHQATGYHLLDFLDTIKGRVDWFVSSGVNKDLYQHGTYGFMTDNLLNCDYPDMKMNEFPYEKEDGSLGFVKLNTVSGDDWSQICLAYYYPELIIVTNDSRMFKSAHAALRGRAIAFHDFLNEISPYWHDDPNWNSLKNWFMVNKLPLRNNSSWILPIS